MKRCPACAKTYPDDARFCERDGRALVAVSPEASGGASGPVPGAPGGRAPTRRLETLPPRTAGPLAPEAPHAHTEPIPTGAISALPPRSRTGPKVAVGILVVIALTLTAVGGYLFLQNKQKAMQEGEIASRIEAAMAQGQLVEPEGESAYDWYGRLRSDFPRSARLSPIQGRVLPVLQQRLDGFYDRWTQTSDADDSEWPTVRRMAQWGSEMAPQSGRLRAQFLYADARNAFENGNMTDAEQQYEAAISAWPEWALPYNSLGVLKAKQKNFRDAANWYEQAAQRSGDWAFPHKNLGGTYVRLGRYEAAERALERASTLRDGFGEAWANLSNALIRADRYADARRTARRALSEGGSGFDRQRMSDRAGYLDVYLRGYNLCYGYQEFIQAYDEGTLFGC